MRAYFVGDTDDEVGYAVVAWTAREAKLLAWKHDWYELFCGSDYTWIDIRAKWIRKANVAGQPEGLLDPAFALREGIYGWYEGDLVCEGCGQETVCSVPFEDKRILCRKCEDEE